MDEERMKEAAKTQSYEMKIVLSAVFVIVFIQLLDTSWCQAVHEDYKAGWKVESALLWLILITLQFAEWISWLVRRPADAYSSFAYCVVSAFTLLYFVLDVLVKGGVVHTLSYADAYVAQLLFSTHFVLNIILHGRRLEHQMHDYCFLVDWVQVTNNAVFFFLVEACALYLKEKSYDPEDLESEFLRWVAFVVILNGVALLVSKMLHDRAKRTYLEGVRQVKEKDDTNMEFLELLLLKTPVAFVSTMTLIAIVGRIHWAWDVWTSLKALMVTFYAISFVVVTVLLFLVQCFRLRLLKASAPVHFFGFRLAPPPEPVEDAADFSVVVEH